MAETDKPYDAQKQSMIANGTARMTDSEWFLWAILYGGASWAFDAPNSNRGRFELETETFDLVVDAMGIPTVTGRAMEAIRKKFREAVT